MKYAIFVLVALMSAPAHAEEWGSFVGSVTTRWLADNRNMELLDDFKYIGPDGVIWMAPKGSVVNGASIPKFAWSIIGGPYEGAYRNASVIHDVACDQQTQTWQDVHRAFFTAMMASHVNELKAKLMFAAVYHFGPRWGSPKRVYLPPSSMPELGNEIRRIRVESGPGTDVVLTDEGSMVERNSGLFGLKKEKEIVGAVVEVRSVQPVYSEKAFDRMRQLIIENNLSAAAIEGLPVFE